MDLSALLSGIQSPDGAIRNQAEVQLNSFEANNYEAFIMALVVELATEGKHIGNRQSAALKLKNLFTATDEGMKAEKMAKWDIVTAATKEQFHLGLLQALRSPEALASAQAAQAVSALAAYEVPRGTWPTLLTTLLSYVNGQEFADVTKVASLNTLGFMCESVNDLNYFDKSIVDQILHTVISGMDTSKPNEIKFAAIKALLDSLAFTEQHFELENERNVIMNSVCGLASCTQMEVRVKTYQCLAEIAERYYKHMYPYMQALFPLTAQAITTDNHEVSSAALYFWTAMFDQESEMIENGEQSLNIAKSVLTHLLPLILDTLLKQIDTDDDDMVTIADSGGICLTALAQSVGDEIIQHIFPFIKTSFDAQTMDWKQKDAGLFAFGTLMATCSEESLHPFVPSALQIIIQGMRDGEWRVRETSAWTMGEILRHQYPLVPKDQGQVDTLVAALMHLVDDSSVSVSRKAISAISNFAEAFYDEEDEPTNDLSKYSQALLGKLLTKAVEANCEVTMEAYEAASMIIEKSALDKHDFVFEVFKEAITRLGSTFQETVSIEDRGIQQSYICALLNVCTRKLPDKYILSVADGLMQFLLQVLDSSNAGAQEEAYQTLGNVADKTLGEFERYVQFAAPLLIKGLKQVDETLVCKHAISSTALICTSLQTKPACIGVYFDAIVQELMSILRSRTADQTLKPLALAALGSLAAAVKEHFEPYGKVVLDIMQAAQAQEIPPDDEDQREQMLDLKESILDAYVDITEGLRSGNKLGVLRPYVENELRFIVNLAEMQGECPDALLDKAIGLIGDLGMAFKRDIMELLTNPMITKTIEVGEQRAQGVGNNQQNESLMATCKWTISVIKNIQSMH